MKYGLPQIPGFSYEMPPCRPHAARPRVSPEEQNRHRSREQNIRLCTTRVSRAECASAPSLPSRVILVMGLPSGVSFLLPGSLRPLSPPGEPLLISAPDCKERSYDKSSFYQVRANTVLDSIDPRIYGQNVEHMGAAGIGGPRSGTGSKASAGSPWVPSGCVGKRSKA